MAKRFISPQVAELIKKYRQEMRLSQVALANLLDVAKQQISQWETGETQPSASMFLKLLALKGKHKRESHASTNNE